MFPGFSIATLLECESLGQFTPVIRVAEPSVVIEIERAIHTMPSVVFPQIEGRSGAPRDGIRINSLLQRGEPVIWVAELNPGFGSQLLTMQKALLHILDWQRFN